MSGVLRLANTGASTGRSTLEASASNDQTFTLPSAGGTLLTSNTSIPGGTITLDGATINITNGDLNVDSGTLFVDESTNRVGIGTTTPLYKFSVFDTASGGASLLDLDNQVLNNYGGLRVTLGATDRECRLQSTYGNSFFTFYTEPSTGGPQERIRITDLGRLLVQTTSTTSNAIAIIQGSPDISSPGRLFLSRRNVATALVDELGVLHFTDSSHNSAAEIRVRRDEGTWSGGVSQPTRMEFRTTPDGSATVQEAMRIDSSKNVKLFTPSVTVANPNILSNYFALVDNYRPGMIMKVPDLYSGEWSFYLDPAASTTSFVIADDSDERLRIDSSGRLLVGRATALNVGATSAATTEIQNSSGFNLSLISTINSSGAGGIAIGKARDGSIVQNGDDLGSIVFAGHDGTDFQTRGASISAQVNGTPGSNDMPGRLVFSTTADGASSPTARLYIASNGGVSINTTATNGHLTITQPNSTHDACLSVSTSTSSSLNNCQAIEVNTHGFYSVNYNHVGIRFKNADNQAGRSNRECDFWNYNDTRIGSITTTTTGTSYNETSDYRLKENVVDLVDGIARVKLLKPRQFNFILAPEHTVDGFIAHEAQEIVPEAVTGEKDQLDSKGKPEYQGIDKSKLVPLLTAALQEAITRIEALESEVSKLRSN